MNEKKISFWNYLRNNYIEIPIIQRDYAQGREGKEVIRRTFLHSLHNALNTPLNSTPLKLDFVYGSEEKADNSDSLNDVIPKILPLDGQQRLTTLWLLHWYIALQNKEIFKKEANVLKKFSYETRLSSREFCENMCMPENFENYVAGTNPVEFITRSTWFFEEWKEDATINAMLRMLQGTPELEVNDEKLSAKEINKRQRINEKNSDDGIYKVFKNLTVDQVNDYWVKLTGDFPKIIFFQQPLKSFGLTDDLYIKMNARGKALTSFENLKADLVGFLTDENQLKVQPELKMYNDISTGFAIKMDTTWTNVFWHNRSSKFSIDDIFLAFIHRFFRNFLFMYKKDNSKDFYLPVGKGMINGIETAAIESSNIHYKYFTDQTPRDYEEFSVYKFDFIESNSEKFPIIPVKLFEDFTTVLDNYSEFLDRLITKDGVDEALKKVNNLLKSPWGDDFYFIPKYKDEKDVVDLPALQRIVFFAFCKYLKEGKVDEESLKRWMRVVWNLISGYDYEGKSELDHIPTSREAMKLLDLLNSHKVYESLRLLVPKDYDKEEIPYPRFKEEIEKAKKIIDENGKLLSHNGRLWEDILKEAEAYNGFRGSVRFLFTTGIGVVDWNLFDEKWNQIQSYFKPNLIDLKEKAVKEEYENKLFKSLVSHMNAEEFEAGIYKRKTICDSVSSWVVNLLNPSLQCAVDKLLRIKGDIITSIEDNSSDWRIHTLYLLSSTDLVNYYNRLDNSQKWYIRDRKEFVSLHPSADGFYLNNNRRDKFLNEIIGRDNVVSDNKKEEIPSLYFGWNIWFRFHEHCFVYYDRNELIYLQNSKWEYIERNPFGQKEEEKYYCIPLGIPGTENWITSEKLEHLIQQYQEDKKKAEESEDLVISEESQKI